MKLKKGFFTTVTPLSKTLALILVIVLPFLGFYIGMQYPFSPSYDQNITMQKYSDPDGYFSFYYPSNWRLDYIGHAQDDPYHSDEWKKKKDIVLSSVEGKVELHWVESYGGGCGEGYGKIMLKSKEYTVCHQVSNNSESWWQIGDRFYEDENRPLGFQLDATADAPVVRNREIVLKILKSFEVYKK